MDAGLDTRIETTDVMRAAFGDIDLSRRLNVLDFGSAEPESVAFYHRYYARICIVNAVDAWGSASTSSLFDLVPARARGLCFDVCLLWDSLNYLTGEAMATFAQELAGYLHKRSRIHAIGAYTPDWAFDANRYAIEDPNRIVIKPRSGSVPHPHSQTEIEKALPGCRIRRAVLRPGNRLELLLGRTRG